MDDGWGKPCGFQWATALATLLRHFFSRRCGFQADKGSRPAGKPGQLFILLFKILNCLTDGWGLNVSVFHKPFILRLELSYCPRAASKRLFLAGRKERVKVEKMSKWLLQL